VDKPVMNFTKFFSPELKPAIASRMNKAEILTAVY